MTDAEWRRFAEVGGLDQFKARPQGPAVEWIDVSAMNLHDWLQLGVQVVTVALLLVIIFRKRS